MNAELIRAELEERGYNFSAIANLLDVSVSYVCRVARRERHNHRVAAAIATALGKSTKAVFPECRSYHHPYRPKDVRQRELAQRLADENLIQRSVG